jgi:hypothetical protein
MKGTTPSLCKNRRRRSSAPFVAELKRRVRITHPFHPRFGEEFKLLDYRRSFGDERVECIDEQDRLITVPLVWTDACGVDPFVRISAGRSFLRAEDLLRLADMLEGLRS